MINQKHSKMDQCSLPLQKPGQLLKIEKKIPYVCFPMIIYLMNGLDNIPVELFRVIVALLDDVSIIMAFHVSKTWRRNYPHPHPRARFIPKKNYAEHVAKKGLLNILKWTQFNCEFDEETAASAAYGGHLHLLQWLKENNCPFDTRATYDAVKMGHLDVLQWFKENNLPLNVNIGYVAKRLGHDNILQWCIKNNISTVQ